MNILSSLHFFYLRKILPGFKINKNALVIDIGSGDKPFWRADVFVDDLSLGDVQRASHSKTIHDIGKFFNANVMKLPFKDKAFDFSFCSHLLEHVENPGAAIKEITRISKNGYIEVPNGILETIRPFNSHLWFVFQDKDGLVFVRKGKRLHEILLNNGIKYDFLLDKIPEPFIRMYWNKTIEYEIVDNYKQYEKFQSQTGNLKNIFKSSFNLYLLMVRMIRFLFYKNKSTVELEKTLYG